mmetsp:Transcript_6608/g.18395  ORF Transcript_6608/g.18395 Transcript_6608/m.18395 type:complete len:210 (-) Transcript_6608:1885-2514(-)
MPLWLSSPPGAPTLPARPITLLSTMLSGSNPASVSGLPSASCAAFAWRPASLASSSRTKRRWRSVCRSWRRSSVLCRHSAMTSSRPSRTSAPRSQCCARACPPSPQTGTPSAHRWRRPSPRHLRERPASRQRWSRRSRPCRRRTRSYRSRWRRPRLPRRPRSARPRMSLRLPSVTWQRASRRPTPPTRISCGALRMPSSSATTQGSRSP